MNCIGQVSWKTKEDMLQDLSAIGQTRINDDFLVIGQRPPPPLKEVDDEFELRFGGTNFGDVSVAPDLNGIRQCLRMVDQSDNEGEGETIPKPNGPVVISKLNPLVREFVPRASSSNSQRVVGDNSSVTVSPRKSSPKNTKKGALKSPQGKVNDDGLQSSPENRVKSPQKLLDNNEKSVKSVVNDATSPSTSTQVTNQNVNDAKIDKDVTVPVLPKDIVEKTYELRNKITDFKADSPKHRIQRNVAIANLLRLHSAKPSPSTSKSNLSTSTEEKELKLMTPDDFIKSAKDTEVNDETTPIEGNGETVGIDENIDIKVDEENDASVGTKSIQESIDKVNNWFEKPKCPVVTTATKSSVCMGPVSFKRKDPNGKSPNGSTVETKVSKSSPIVAQFKPSKYADDLAKKYMERNEAKERREMSIWDNLEKELKLKDEEIKKKRAMQDRNL